MSREELVCYSRVKDTEILNKSNGLNKESALSLVHYNGNNDQGETYYKKNERICNSGINKESRDNSNTLANNFLAYAKNHYVSTHFTENTGCNNTGLRYNLGNSANYKPNHVNKGFKHKNIQKKVLYLMLILVLGLVAFVDIRGESSERWQPCSLEPLSE